MTLHTSRLAMEYLQPAILAKEAIYVGVGLPLSQKSIQKGVCGLQGNLKQRHGFWQYLTQLQQIREDPMSIQGHLSAVLVNTHPSQTNKMGCVLMSSLDDCPSGKKNLCISVL